jgi:outer membrane lipoprotein-sorting protein
MTSLRRFGVPLIALILVLAGGTVSAFTVTDGGHPAAIGGQQPTASDEQPLGADIVRHISDEQPSGADIAQQVQDTYAEMDEYKAVQTTTVETDDWTYDSKARIWFKGSDKQRTEVLSGNQSGDVFVANETTFLSYDASEETVDVLDRSDVNQSASTVGVHEGVMQSLANSEVSYEGTASVAGHETYVLKLTPQNSLNDQAPSSVTQTLWVDQDTYQVVQLQTEEQIEGQQATVTTQFENMEIDSGIPNSIFEFEPPADADIQEVEA